LVEDFWSSEGDGNFGISGWGVCVIVNVSDVWIVRGEGFENVVVIIEIECDSVSQFFSPYLIIPVYIVFEIMYIKKLKKMRPKPHLVDMENFLVFRVKKERLEQSSIFVC
jgi:hypothetical protein